MPRSAGELLEQILEQLKKLPREQQILQHRLPGNQGVAGLSDRANAAYQGLASAGQFHPLLGAAASTVGAGLGLGRAMDRIFAPSQVEKTDMAKAHERFVKKANARLDLAWVPNLKKHQLGNPRVVDSSPGMDLSEFPDVRPGGSTMPMASPETMPGEMPETGALPTMQVDGSQTRDTGAYKTAWQHYDMLPTGLGQVEKADFGPFGGHEWRDIANMKTRVDFGLATRRPYPFMDSGAFEAQGQPEFNMGGSIYEREPESKALGRHFDALVDEVRRGIDDEGTDGTGTPMAGLRNQEDMRPPPPERSVYKFQTQEAKIGPPSREELKGDKEGGFLDDIPILNWFLG